jgi:hypothetical protein
MLRLPLAVLVLTVACAVDSPAVFAKGSVGKVDDVAATRAYLLARHRFELSAAHDQRPSEAAVQALVAGVKNECPGVLAGAPESRARDAIRAEIGEDVPLTLERPARDATLAFAKTVQRLRWSNRKLTYYATHSAREEAAKENVALPDICADAKAFAASGFAAAPASTETFLSSCDAANSITTIEFHKGGETGDLDERILHLLKPYERPDEKALIPHKLTKVELEQVVPAIERQLATPIVEIAHALGLPE